MLKITTRRQSLKLQNEAYSWSINSTLIITRSVASLQRAQPSRRLSTAAVVLFITVRQTSS